ncbi:hypothetical protein ACWGPT_18655 [Pseudorhizobium sp. NPDC055634]
MELLASQLMDPFRIGLVFFLLLTALRTRAATGMVVPLGLGVVFVAILLPLTTARTEEQTGDLVMTVATGIAANALILSVFLAAWTVWRRVR